MFYNVSSLPFYVVVGVWKVRESLVEAGSRTGEAKLVGEGMSCVLKGAPMARDVVEPPPLAVSNLFFVASVLANVEFDGSKVGLWDRATEVGKSFMACLASMGGWPVDLCSELEKWCRNVKHPSKTCCFGGERLASVKLEGGLAFPWHEEEQAEVGAGDWVAACRANKTRPCTLR